MFKSPSPLRCSISATATSFCFEVYFLFQNQQKFGLCLASVFAKFQCLERSRSRSSFRPPFLRFTWWVSFPVASFSLILLWNHEILSAVLWTVIVFSPVCLLRVSSKPCSFSCFRIAGCTNYFHYRLSELLGYCVDFPRLLIDI